MRTTLLVDDGLLQEVKDLSGAKTKKEAVNVALADYVMRKRARKLLELEGRIDLAFSRDDLLKRRGDDVPHR